MSWIQKLYETYENCQSNVGLKNEENKAPLLPISHILQKAQIEISIDQNGNLKGANQVSKEDAFTIIPCTEESGSRSGSDPKCHPLCDKLQYLARDFCEYIEELTPEYKEKQAKCINNTLNYSQSGVDPNFHILN
jgi:CRISPR-associated protein Csd1